HPKHQSPDLIRARALRDLTRRVAEREYRLDVYPRPSSLFQHLRARGMIAEADRDACVKVYAIVGHRPGQSFRPVHAQKIATDLPLLLYRRSFDADDLQGSWMDRRPLVTRFAA